MGLVRHAAPAKALLVLTAVLAPALALKAGCILSDFERVGAAGGAGGAGLGGSDAGDVDADAGPDVSVTTCVPRRPPANDPSAADGPSLPDLVFAVRAINLGEEGLTVKSTGEREIDPGYEPVGYDLDGYCTCLDDAGTQGNPGCNVPSFAADGYRCDFAEGIDSSMSWFFAQAAVLLDGFSSSGYTMAAEEGLWSLVLRVADYNGEPNDPSVRLYVYNTFGVDPYDCTAPADPDAGPPPECNIDPMVPFSLTPAWDGDDCWSVTKATLADPNDLDSTEAADLKAFVRDGVLVASVPKAGIVLAGGDGAFRIQLVAGVISARIAPAGGGYALQDGVIAGRWPLDRVLGSLSEFKVLGSTLCTNIPYYTPIKLEMCKLAESLSMLGGPTEPCDSVSFALGFQATQAKLGRVCDRPTDLGECTCETDPANDSCEGPLDAGCDGG